VLGRFLEFSVPTRDVVESLGFYRALGFTELLTGEVWSHPYAVVSDGEISIGLHGGGIDAATLTFVCHDLAREARSMADSGFEFDTMQLDEDVFNQLRFVCRDGHQVAMIEARTFSKAGDDLGVSACGRLLELTLPVRDATRAGLFWAPLAPELLRLREEPTVHMRFNAAGLSLGLSESIALECPSLSFRCNDLEAIWIKLAQHGFVHSELPGFEGAPIALTAPEGTPLFLFREDFLGELYEVEEGEPAN